MSYHFSKLVFENTTDQNANTISDRSVTTGQRGKGFTGVSPRPAYRSERTIHSASWPTPEPCTEMPGWWIPRCLQTECCREGKDHRDHWTIRRNLRTTPPSTTEEEWDWPNIPPAWQVISAKRTETHVCLAFPLIIYQSSFIIQILIKETTKTD